MMVDPGHNCLCCLRNREEFPSLFYIPSCQLAEPFSYQWPTREQMWRQTFWLDERVTLCGLFESLHLANKMLKGKPMFTPCGIAYLLPATPMNIRGWLQGIWDSSLQQGCIFRKGLFAIPDHPSSNPASPGPNRGLTSPEDIRPYPKAAPQKKQKAS